MHKKIMKEGIKVYKLVAIDCDGTLLNDQKELTERTINSIKNASQKVKIVISTARSFYRVEEYLRKMNLLKNDQYTICLNGGCIVNNGNQKEIESHTFIKDDIEELIQLSRKLGTQISLYAYNRLIVEKIPERFKNNKKINFEIVKTEQLEIDKYNIYKIVFVDKPEKIIKMRKELDKKVLEKYEVTSSIPEYIEFVPKGITKQKSLENLCNILGIEKREVIAIGDAENDIEMIQFAGLGIAMENAGNIVKEIADDITDSNNEDGVAKAIEKYIV